MYILDFVIPLNREDLCEATLTGQFSVTETYSIADIKEQLKAAKTACTEEGTDFIVDHFATFFSLFQKFKQVPDVVKENGWRIIIKAFQLLSSNLNVMFDDIANVDSEVQNKMCNITKMIVYTLIEFMKLYQDKHTDQSSVLADAKGKKKQVKITDGWDWNDEKHKVFIEIYNFLQMPLKLLWEPPVVDEEFVNLIANFCYKCLEDPSISGTNLKYLRETIFQILGVLIKSYLHGLSFCVKVVQLLRMNEHVVNPLAQGVVQLVKECSCNNVVKEIVREIANTDGDQLVADSAGTRSLNVFVVHLAESIPESVIPAIDLLLHHLNGDSYTMRICVLGVLGEIVHTTLTKENLDEDLKKMRDEFLESLEDHIHDSNAFVRTKVLQVLQKLCLAKAIPISRTNRMLKLTVGRLNDKSTNVKKQAVHLIKCLLEGNPFSGDLNTSEIRIQLNEEAKKLEKLKEGNNFTMWKDVEPKLRNILENRDDESDSEEENSTETLEEAIERVGRHLLNEEYEKAVGALTALENEFHTLLGIRKSKDSDESLLLILQKIFEQKGKPVKDISAEVLEEVEKREKTKEYLEHALQFAEQIDRALPIILTLLDSTQTTDVLESINFFSAAYLFGFQQALEGVRKMLDLVFSKEANIKAAVSSAYKDLYFRTNATGRQHSLTAVKNLSDLILKLNPSQSDALEQVVREWVKADVIDKHCIQVLFERFSMKIAGTSEEHSWAALVLIRMVGSEKSSVIKSNIPVLLNQGLGNRGLKNFLLAKEACKALSYLLPAKTPGKQLDQTQRYTRDHEIFTCVYKLLRDGLWRADDSRYIPMAEQAINLVFALCDHPNSFAAELVADLHHRIVTGKRPVQKDLSEGKNLLTNSGRCDDLLAADEELPVTNTDSNVNDEDEEKVEEEENPIGINIVLLTRFLSILGQIAVNYVLYLEGPILDELKRRNQIEYERKLKKFQKNKRSNLSFKKGRLEQSNDGGDDGKEDKTVHEVGSEDLEFNRVAADDMDAEEIKKKTENEIVNGKGFLGKFTPLILAICKNPGKYSNAALQNAAVVALARYMHVSSVFCEEHLQLLVTICEKSPCAKLRENAIITLGALQYRFPNSLEPWTAYMYGMLKDSNPSVRLSSIMVLTDLIVNEMIKVRSYVSDLAVAIVDKEIRIAQSARHFFREYSQKGNCLYNVLPSLISNLTQPNSPLAEEEFKITMKFILGLITKDKQSEYLVEKLCQYFEAATTERQWKDLAYCLSLLNYTEKGLKKVMENLRCYANKLYLADVYEAFCTILSNSGKNPQKDKTLIKEMQDVIKEYRDKSCEDRNIPIPPVQRKCLQSPKKRIVRRKLMSSSSEDEDCIAHRRASRVKKDIARDESDDDAFLSDASSKKSFKVRTIRKKTRSKKSQHFDEESDSDESQQKQTKKVRSRQENAKKSKSRQRYSDDSSEEEVRATVRSTRKRK